jgi:serine/threonine-protein kinase
MGSPAALATTVPIVPGDVIADKYRVDQVLGAGGMGFVLAATNVHLSKRVAIKMMLPQALKMAGAVERFEREARAAVRLKSEHVAQVLDIGQLPDKAPYIVMELLEGHDFEEMVSARGPLPVGEAVDYMLQACEAIAEAHATGIVHRDLKLKNLFLSRRLDGSPLVKVLDFGISKWTVADVAAHSLTGTSDVIGSPNYMSPEQVRSARDVDHRTDIWSLGVVLFELLTGRVPFLADTLPALCAMVLEQPAPPIATLRTDLPPGVGAIIATCLEKARENRFQSVVELASALAPFGSGTTRFRAGVSPVAATMPVGSAASQIGNEPTIGLPETIAKHLSKPPSGTVMSSMTARPGLAVALTIAGALVACAMVAMLWFGATLLRAKAKHPTAPSASSPPSALPPASASAPVVPASVTVTATATAPAAPPPSEEPTAAATAKAPTPRSKAPTPKTPTPPKTPSPPGDNPFEPTDRK